MDQNQLQEIKALFELMKKQGDRAIIKTILKNILLKAKRYGLMKDEEMQKTFLALAAAQDLVAVFREVDVCLEGINKRIIEQNRMMEGRREEYFPDFITANKLVLEKIKDAIKIKRVKEKLRSLFDSIANNEFFRQHSRGYPKFKTIDLFCLNLDITSGLTIRILYFIENRKLRCCDFFINHDAYQSAINSKVYLKKNYGNEQWFRILRF